MFGIHIGIGIIIFLMSNFMNTFNNITIDDRIIIFFIVRMVITIFNAIRTFTFILTIFNVIIVIIITAFIVVN